MRMKTMTAAALVAVLTAPASAGEYGVVHGVDADAVPWPEFCASVQAVPVERGGQRCAAGHPASEYHGRFRDWSGRNQNPPANCDIVAEEWRQWTTSVEGSSDPWAPCRVAWGRALQARATEPERFGEPFRAWRQRYFGLWLKVGGEE